MFSSKNFGVNLLAYRTIAKIFRHNQLKLVQISLVSYIFLKIFLWEQAPPTSVERLTPLALTEQYLKTIQSPLFSQILHKPFF